MKSSGSISLLPIALPERPSTRAFTIQYTTLILIIISFIVGAFGGHPSTRRELTTVSKQHEPLMIEPGQPVVTADKTASREIEGRIPSDAIRIEHLFRAASVELDSAKAAAIATVLKSHDIDAEIDVVADSMGEEDYRIALRQARSISRYLLNSGVPARAFRVFVVESKVPEWAAMETESSTSVRFYRENTDGK